MVRRENFQGAGQDSSTVNARHLASSFEELRLRLMLARAGLMLTAGST